MNDFELNKAIAEALGINLEPDSEYKSHGEISSCVMWYEGKTYHSANYCNNWSDLMPLVVEYGIAFGQINSIESEVKYFQAGRWTIPFRKMKPYTCESTNPQRALAECLLKVLEAK